MHRHKNSATDQFWPAHRNQVVALHIIYSIHICCTRNSEAKCNIQIVLNIEYELFMII